MSGSDGLTEYQRGYINGRDEALHVHDRNRPMHDHPRPFCGEGCPAFGDPLARYRRPSPSKPPAEQVGD